jgi:hypothetical protein
MLLQGSIAVPKVSRYSCPHHSVFARHVLANDLYGISIPSVESCQGLPNAQTVATLFSACHLSMASLQKQASMFRSI